MGRWGLGNEGDEVVDGKGVVGKPIHQLVLKTVRVEIVDTLIAEIKSYFPRGETDALSVFDINLFPTDKLDYPDYGVEEVGQVALQGTDFLEGTR